MRSKKIICIALCAVMAAGAAVGLASCKKGKTDANTYTLWTSSLDESGFYTDENSNPVKQYIEDNLQFNGKNVKFEYYAPAVSSKANEQLQTMLSTGNMYDILDVSMSDTTVAEMYEDGAILDLTDYIEEYMPNYTAWLEEHPEEAKQLIYYLDEDGDGQLEGHYLSLFCINQRPADAFQGWMYRRDWILEYGTFPYDVTAEESPDGKAHSKGEKFSGGYDAEGNWTDNIMFPSYKSEAGLDYRTYYSDTYAADWDGTFPVFISDWEWMFDCFNAALEDSIGILSRSNTSGGYALSMYYEGFYPTGHLISAFGGDEVGGLALRDGEVYNGATSDNMRTYLYAMNKWYEEDKYIDSFFSTRTSSTYPWMVNPSFEATGRVGMWNGLLGQTGSALRNTENELTADIYVSSCRPPINDVYDEYSSSARYSSSNRFVPSSFYQSSLVDSEWVITIKAEEKDLETLFTFLDWAYDDENYLLCNGLTDEQIELAKEKGYGENVYEEQNVSSMGSWVDGKFVSVPEVAEVDGLVGALVWNRLPHLNANGNNLTAGTESYQFAVKEQAVYTNTGYQKLDYLLNYVTDDKERREINKILIDYETFAKQEVYRFVTGDYSVESDWQDYAENVDNKKGFATYITKMTELYEQFGK